MNALAKKLQIRSGSNWLLYNAPANYHGLLEPLPDGASITSSIGGEFDGVLIFVKNSAELSEYLPLMVPILKQRKDTIFWVIYPKKSSNIPTDLAMTSSWEQVESYGLTSVAAAAVDTTWTALRVRPVELIKVADTRNEKILHNDYSEYIDVVNKQIRLPQEITDALEKFPAAMAAYHALAYSHRKEYVLWILTAKQEKTRLDRLTKMVEKLLLGKKNPGDK